MQNKPNLPNAQMNVTSVKTMNYEQKTMNYANKKQTQSNPISVQKTCTFANFLLTSTHFCLTYFNTCVFARAKTLLTTQKQRLYPRHNAAVNGVFLDLSARKIGLKELWEIWWQKDWNPNNDPPPDFCTPTPTYNGWMCNMKDFP